MGSLDQQLLREHVLQLVCKLNSLLLNIYGSFAQEGWWIAHYKHTLKFVVLLFSLSYYLAGAVVGLLHC